MKRLILTYLLTLACVFASAQVRFDYNVSTQTLFDNRECDKQGNLYTRSSTIFGTNVIPEVGLRAVTGSEDGGYGAKGLSYHHFMVGVELHKDFGSKQGIKDVFKELTIYYSLDKQISRGCRLHMTAGIFPRSYSKEEFSEVFYSDSTKFYDPNFEGLMFRFERPMSAFELGCDWLGQYDKGNRERFMIFSAGHGDVLPWMRLGYSAYMFHFANSVEVRGVVDNAIVNPYIMFDAAPYLPMQELSAKLGYIIAYQRDRINMSHPSLPMGGELVCEARKWNVRVKNTLYFGQDLMPLYNCYDAGGYKYGNVLYYGDPHYRVRPNGEAATKPACMDHVEAFWEPSIAPGLQLRLGAIFYFNRGFSGSCQVIDLRFNLHELQNGLKARREK